ncbi:protein FAM200C-like [Penaeus indicus]|uniref:protein FAM200C-like n=1 Tax=Penaeus indicus TaxID=29960 RepID=UPI00300D20F1
MKRQRLDASGSFHQQNAAVVETSFLVSLEIAKKKKPHTIGEELILPCAKTMVKIVLGEKRAEKLNAISLSNNTVQRRISQISDDIKEQVIQEIKRAGLFSIQLDESTDVQSCSQLLAFVRYVHDEDLKEEFLFCEPLEQSTKGEDVMQKLTEFFEAEGLDWGNLCGICTDGAPAMLGSQSGFVTRVIQKAPNAIPLHCMIHRQALASKTLPSELQDTLNTIIKTVNFVKVHKANKLMEANEEKGPGLDAENQAKLRFQEELQNLGLESGHSEFGSCCRPCKPHRKFELRSKSRKGILRSISVGSG